MQRATTPSSPDLHVMAIGNGYTVLRHYTAEGRRFMEQRGLEWHTPERDTHIDRAPVIVAIAEEATGSGLRVRFN
ncbi:hypothetical protein [Azospirillum sp. Sh1]|uniref:hypothetical protein n=1 Tax=Azospirillum sp. Sh1 TaxID=2607285 RepID=UPI0011EF24C8|nr:hypothetical protein [Azospirillum sp. Sh1]KAA0576693.1 hypothetical protein FZ029_12565 [Azospirillum sp. Sh1]